MSYAGEKMPTEAWQILQENPNARLVDVERNVAREDEFSPLEVGDPACAGCRFRRSCDR